MREPPIIGIDPGTRSGIAIYRGSGSKIKTYTSRAAPFDMILDAYLPAYVFIERPVGDSLATPSLWHLVNRYQDALTNFGPRNRPPATQWRKAILGDGAATKDDAVAYVAQHFPSLGGRFIDPDEAEAICVSLYGHRLVTGKVDHSPVLVPDCDLRPAERRGKGSGLRGRIAETWIGCESGRTAEDYDDPPRVPWRLIAQDGGPDLYAALRVWASGYIFAAEQASVRERRVSKRAWAADAHVAYPTLDKAIQWLIDARLVERDGEVLIFRPVRYLLWRDQRSVAALQPLIEKLAPKAHKLLADWNAGRVDPPPLRPSDWKRAADRARRDARPECRICGSRNVPPWALDDDVHLCVDHYKDDDADTEADE
jgi:hypothetical protein